MQLTDTETTTGALAPERLREALRTFRDTGVVVLENAYPREFIAQVREAYDIELERFLEARGGLAAMEGKTFGKNHIGFFPPMFAPLADARIAAHPLAIQILREVLGAEMQCSFFHTNTAYIDSGTQPVHRDQGHLFGTELGVAHPATHVVINIPLCDFTVANGSTEYWPGTHLIVDTRPEDGKELEARAATLPSARLNVPMGSLVLRDMRVWHRGMPNPSEATRTMMAIVWMRGWLAQKTITIPRTTWESWPEEAQKVYRKNTVVEDEEHRAISWEELRA